MMRSMFRGCCFSGAFVFFWLAVIVSAPALALMGVSLLCAQGTEDGVILP